MKDKTCELCGRTGHLKAVCWKKEGAADKAEGSNPKGKSYEPSPTKSLKATMSAETQSWKCVYCDISNPFGSSKCKGCLKEMVASQKEWIKQEKQKDGAKTVISKEAEKAANTILDRETASAPAMSGVPPVPIGPKLTEQEEKQLAETETTIKTLEEAKVAKEVIEPFRRIAKDLNRKKNASQEVKASADLKTVAGERDRLIKEKQNRLA